ncbi:MAG: bifunctional 5,10-methylenetetrahydrofolate dehydrogenase/5,10-methenyltetrahydrofolate cyclohydrolase [Candidatus Saccharibacteria bacterium]
MKLLNGSELAGYIKQRQVHQVRALIQTDKISPKLAIIACSDNPITAIYTKLKKQYGADILVDVDIYNIEQNEIANLINKLNIAQDIQGIILQLPLKDPKNTQELLNAIAPQKDIDGLGENAAWDTATPMAIMWLLAGYDIDLNTKNVVIIGRGRLVGAPLKKMFDNSGVDSQVIHSQTINPQDIMKNAQVIISAVGKPGILESDMIPQNCIVIDAGTASENGVQKGDLADDVYERQDLTVTPKKGGIGPLTVCALFDNLIRSASKK